MKRVLAAVTAVALMSFAPLALTSSASAAPDTTSSYGSSPGVEQEYAQEAKRRVTFFGQRRGNRFFVAGRVTPGYKNSRVIIQRATCRGNGCNSPNFKRVNQIKTNGQGRYRTRIATPGRVGTTFRYRVLIPKRGNYSAFLSKRTYDVTRTS